ncbi:rhomboid family intramembrane serine protease [Malonomonas rubra]|uniref:rhomboid family intramembrane serine protease n=1 Tax=Malonomonas rubra TaxID=57040 RepID=UPI0026EB0792|nr:rhomboid family intramembrane serine protease [Malonomonas rubra]
MLEKNSISIDQLDWVAIPIQLTDGLQNRPLSKRQLRIWTLVLQARQIPCHSQRLEHGWLLLVPTRSYQQALDELQAYEKANRNWPPPLPELPPQQDNTVTTIWVLIALALFHVLTQKQIDLLGHSPVNWYQLGNAAADQILAGQWWRVVTALTLHSGGIHLAGNIIIGGIFVNRICRDLGAGLGWSLVLASGASGNLLNALMQTPAHRSIGASTAVFGAVGLLATINMLRYRTSLRHRWPIPLAAALALLALLGVGGENTDIGAHLFGFASGIALGLLAALYLDKRPPLSRRWQRVLALVTLCITIFCWFLALR